MNLKRLLCIGVLGGAVLTFLVFTLTGCSRYTTWERVSYTGNGGGGTLGKDDYREHFYGVVPPSGACSGPVTVVVSSEDVSATVDSTLSPADFWGRLTVDLVKFPGGKCEAGGWYEANHVTVFLSDWERVNEFIHHSGPPDPAIAAQAIEELEKH